MNLIKQYSSLFVPGFLALTFLCLGLISCEKQTRWDLQQENIQTVVVDGILTNELKPHCIKLSLVNSAINQPAQSLSGAKVIVTEGSGTYTFTESLINPGSYYSQPFQAVIGKSYKLNIEYQNHKFEATATMAPLTEHASIAYSFDDNKQLYKYTAESDGDPVMIEVITDWSHDAGYTTKYGNSKALQLFYILNNVDASKIFAPEKEIIYFPVGTKIIRRHYSLTQQHQTFLRSLLMETEWRGGVFDVQPGNVITNIGNGGLGFFAICMVGEDSVVVK